MRKTEPLHSAYVEVKLPTPFLNKDYLLFWDDLRPTIFFPVNISFSSRNHGIENGSNGNFKKSFCGELDLQVIFGCLFLHLF